MDFSARPNRIPWPPAIYAGTIGLAVILGWLWPWTSSPGDAMRGVGVAIMAVGAGFDVSAMLTMARRRANILPHRAATALVTSGPFALSRNPIYLGNALMLAGAAPTFGNPWFLALVPVAVLLVTTLAIRREEHHLAARFGPAWTTYAARTPRWIGVGRPDSAQTRKGPGAL
jgi:protein-S-isoprenylcysteine O-methyltransferase Ste14